MAPVLHLQGEVHMRLKSLISIEKFTNHHGQVTDSGVQSALTGSNMPIIPGSITPISDSGLGAPAHPGYSRRRSRAAAALQGPLVAQIVEAAGQSAVGTAPAAAPLQDLLQAPSPCSRG